MMVLACLPWLDRRLRDKTVARLTDPRIVLYEWDNSPPFANIGVAPVWHAAGQLVLDTLEFDWLLLCSTAIVLAPNGATQLCDAMERAEHYPAPRPDIPRIVSGIGCGWHLTAFHRDVLRIVGNFDANYIAYFEDSDWIYRHTLAGLGNLWHEGNIQAHVDLDTNRGDAHSIQRGLVTPDLFWAAQLYQRKWGGSQNRELYTHPYNDPTLDWTYTGAPR